MTLHSFTALVSGIRVAISRAQFLASNGAFDMKSTRAKRGQVIVLVALSVTVLLGFLGLATDVGVLWATKRRAQTAADAAAVAGANATLGTDSSGYSTAANDVATLNGFTNGANGTTITVTQPS